MNRNGLFTARLLDSGLRSYAAATVMREREALRASGVALPPGAFDDMVRDTEARLLHLGEALATGRAALFVGHLEWSRSTYAARGLPDERLALHLRCLREELGSELPPSGRAAALEILDEASGAFENPPHPIESVLEADGPHADLIRRLLLAVLEGRRDDALDLVLGAATNGTTIEALQSQVLIPVQEEIGRMWQRGEIHVHEEHVCSQIVEEALILLSGRSARKPSCGKTVLVSSVSGNLHEIGARVVADRFQADGWNAIRLGASLPGEDLARAALDFHGDLLALSVTMALHVRSTAAIIAHVRGELGAQVPPILVGGPPFALVPDLWEAVGADGTAADAQGAVREGRRLLALAPA